MSLKGKTVLITGSTGFVGANLTRHLIKLGIKPHVFLRKESNVWRIKDKMSGLVVHYCDLQAQDETNSLIKDIRPQIVFHTAAYGGSPAQSDAGKMVKVNYLGTVALLNACREAEFELFVNTGSSSEYGPKDKAMRENDKLGPINEYGATKAAATLYCQAIAKKEGRPIVTLRLFSPFGPWEDISRLVPAVIASCLKGKDPEVSSPRPVRDFVFIEDVVEAYIKAAENKDKISGEIINIARGRQESVGRVLELAIKLTGANVSPAWNKVVNPRVEPKAWRADISKAQRVLDWSPEHNLKEGLTRTVAWFRENTSLYKEGRE
jgi:nucleoside-diphosphate-sugar epimerase